MHGLHKIFFLFAIMVQFLRIIIQAAQQRSLSLKSAQFRAAGEAVRVVAEGCLLSVERLEFFLCDLDWLVLGAGY